MHVCTVQLHTGKAMIRCSAIAKSANRGLRYLLDITRLCTVGIYGDDGDIAVINPWDKWNFAAFCRANSSECGTRPTACFIRPVM